jgi:hypothetical protein
VNPPIDELARKSALRSRSLLVILAGVGALGIAGLWLALEHGTIAVWHLVVHESGRYTLAQTVFYFRHFLREVPTLFTVALFVVAAYGSPAVPAAERPRARRMGLLYASGLLFACVMIVVAFRATAAEHGSLSAWTNLMQYHTRDDLASYGSHWRFHWLSTLWLGLATSLSATVTARWLAAPAPHDTRARRLMGAVAWGWFWGLSLVFVPTLEPVLDPRFIGHQAREILTHSLVTLPMAMGLLALVLRHHGHQPKLSRLALKVPVSRAAVVLAIPAYLGFATIASEAMSHGQTAGGLAAMVAAHFFEHVLDYVFVALLCVGGYGLLLVRAGRRSPPA